MHHRGRREGGWSARVMVVKRRDGDRKLVMVVIMTGRVSIPPSSTRAPQILTFPEGNRRV